MEARIRARLAQVHPLLGGVRFQYLEDLATNRAGKRRWFVDHRTHVPCAVIAGILGRPAADTSAALLRMQACLRHRGPDGEGTWRSPSGIADFAHTRLAVIDPSPAARQPMSSANGNLTIVFSGEIYNFRELRKDLERRGAAFRTESDTEVILHGYEMHGAEFIPQLRGMFAFALWNERERSCVLARDAFGLKPLYFHHGLDGTLTFASEVRALAASGTLSLDLDARGLHGYLRTGSVPEPRTLLKGVSALEAGRVLTWRAGLVATRTYRTLQFTGEGAGNHHADIVRTAIVDSVRHHFVSDVPVGILLSGGVDSAALLAVATENGQRGVRTISMALPGSADDEGPLARRTAERFGSQHLELAVTAGAALSLFPSYLNSIDQPSIDGFNTFAVSRFARERGLKVVLSGVGADEVFGGYASFTRVPRITGWNARLARMGPLRPLGGRALEAMATAPRWRRVGELLQQPPTLTNTYAMFRGIFTNREAAVIARTFGVDAVGIDGPADEPIEAPTPRGRGEQPRADALRAQSAGARERCCQHGVRCRTARAVSRSAAVRHAGWYSGGDQARRRQAVTARRGAGAA